MVNVFHQMVSYVNNNPSIKVVLTALVIMSICLISLSVGQFIGRAIYHIFG